MPEPASVPSATEPIPGRAAKRHPELSGECHSAPNSDPTARRTDGWGLAMEAALNQKAEVPPSSSPSASAWAEMAAQRQDARLWRLLARACEEKGEYREALGYVTEALRVQPDDVASLSLLAQLHEKRHAESDAARCHQQVLAQDPTRKTSNRFLAHYHYARGAYEQAFQHFTHLLEAEPQIRINKLYCVLTRVKMSGIRGVAKFLAEVHGWRDVSPEERALMHELFVVVGRRCLQNKQIVRAMQYLTWAVELVPTPEAQALLADATAQDPWAAKNSETVTSTAQPVSLRDNLLAWYQGLALHTLSLRPMMATVGAMALAVALGLFLLSAQPRDLLSQPEEPLVSSAFVLHPSPMMPGTPGVVPTDHVREPGRPTDTTPLQAETSTLPPKASVPVKGSSTNRSLIKGKSNPAEVVPVGMAKSLQVAVSTAVPGTQLPEEKPNRPLRESERQPSRIEESENGAAMAAMVSQEVGGQESQPLANATTPESSDATQPIALVAMVPPSLAQPENNEKREEGRGGASVASFTEETESVIATLAAQLPFARQFPIREREFALSPEQLWPQLKTVVEEETEVLLYEDEVQRVLHGAIVQRQLRPRLHTFKPYGHYFVEVVPGTREGTSLVRAKILTFEWRTKRPTPGAEQLADRFLQQIAAIIK